MMQQVMGNIGQNPGLLGRIPGFKQLGQLSQMKGMDLSQVFGKDAKMMEAAMGGGPMQMQMPQLAPGYTPPMGQAAMAKARLMGYSTQAMAKGADSKERDALKKKRKQEKAARKKNRRK
jgi:signal recognition particle subunit SRP54